MLEKLYSNKQLMLVLIETKPMDEGKFGLEMLTKLATSKKEKAMKVIDERKAMGLPVPFKASSEKEASISQRVRGYTNPLFFYFF